LEAVKKERRREKRGLKERFLSERKISRGKGKRELGKKKGTKTLKPKERTVPVEKKVGRKKGSPGGKNTEDWLRGQGVQKVHRTNRACV